MCMAVSAKSDYMLKPLHKCMVSQTKLVLAMIRLVMTNHKCYSTLSFHAEQLFCKPSDLSTRIISLPPQKEIIVCTSIGINCDDSRSKRQAFAILQTTDRHTVKAILSKLLEWISICEPIGPDLFQNIDFSHIIWHGKGLYRLYPRIMIALDGQYSDIVPLNGIFEHISR